MSICESQLEAILEISANNSRREDNHELKLLQWQIEHRLWKINHDKWLQKKNIESKTISDKSNYIEYQGKPVNCDDWSKRTTCCSLLFSDTEGMVRTKCAVQNKGSNMKCKLSYGHCKSYPCNKSENKIYCNNKLVDNLPQSASVWVLDSGAPPEPKEPEFNEKLILEEYPAIVCQDCSTSIEALKSTDISFEDIDQASSCVSNISSVNESESNPNSVNNNLLENENNNNSNENKNNSNENEKETNNNNKILLIVLGGFGIVSVLGITGYMVSKSKK